MSSERHPDKLDNFNQYTETMVLALARIRFSCDKLFKQGQLQFNDFDYNTAVTNRTQEIAIPNINETDVFVQEINNSGATLAKWKQIPNTVGQTLNYNDLAFSTRTLYAVENLNNAGIKIRQT